MHARPRLSSYSKWTAYSGSSSVATLRRPGVRERPPTLTALPRFPDPTAQHAPGSLLAPMPGTVVRVADGLAAAPPYRPEQPLLWLEAMKMEHKITAPATGTLTALHAVPGQQVEVGALLAVVQDAP